MFFFIAGIQPRTVEEEGQPRMCPACGLVQAKTKRVDHWLSVFFVPLIRVKKGHPFLECLSCGSVSDVSGQASYSTPSSLRRCPACGEPQEPAFRFCPYCGRKLP